MSSPQPPPLRIFLNHRYRSPQVNLPMYKLMANSRRLQFEVDRRTKSTNTTTTNTTRLEVMMRKVDAFVSILALHGDALDSPSASEVANQSRYFRLELDIAVRARKPCFVIVDERFGNRITAPGEVHTVTFPMQDLEGDLVRQEILGKFENFWEYAMTLAQGNAKVDRRPEFRVGYVVPESFTTQIPDLQRKIETAVSDNVCEPVRFPWPPRMDTHFLKEVRRCDWVIVECGVVESALVVGYLRGQAIPVLRTRFQGSAAESDERLDHWDQLLFGELHDHYRKNLVLWSDSDVLAERLSVQMDEIRSQATLIASPEKANEYFQRANQAVDAPPDPSPIRRERVFVSYADEDREYAATMISALREHFEDVFDYRTNGSIPHGETWLEYILERIQQSAVGIPLVSASYAASPYCRKESLRMNKAHIEGRMDVFPVLLDGCRVPDFIDVQDVKAHEVPVAKIARNIADKMAQLDERGRS